MVKILPDKSGLIEDIALAIKRVQRGEVKEGRFCKFEIEGMLFKVLGTIKALSLFLDNVRHCPVHGETMESPKQMFRRACNGNWTQKRMYCADLN